jgi:hypothetical protein
MNLHSIVVMALFLCVILPCCYNNKQDVLVNGQILDEETGKPLANAEVVVLCWYNYGLDDATYEKQKLETDAKGSFSARFKEGYQVDVASKAAGYLPTRAYNELSTNRVTVNLKLSRQKTNPSLKAYLITDFSGRDITDSTPFLRTRFSYDSSEKLTRISTFGFALDQLRTSNDTSECDIWFRPTNKEGQPTVICANNKGGIIPVYSNAIASSFFYEKTTAPLNGYFREYTLQGNEEGFFVLSRDGRTYAKLIFEKSVVDISSPDVNGGSYKEYGKYFSCLYQPNGTNDLSYSSPDIDLIDFLVDFQLQ